MGIATTLKALVGSSDEAAKTTDEATEVIDEAAETVDQGHHIDFSDERFSKALTADLLARAAEQPSRAVDAGTSNVVRATKYGGGAAVAGTSVYAGSEAYQAFQESQIQESKEATFSEYQAAAQEIRNSDMSPEQKQDALENLRESYNKAIDEASDSDSGGIFSNLGLVEKLILGAVAITLIKAATEAA